ncbi:terpene synthase family protein [Streptomyces sp. NBC_00576]|uniref:terpene synthase family protein n=1 Tax=Streptomyces sp. NBC_00576 TaxID=2903665 RepID=UPI002E7FEB10|nr:terpene synthase family protein [Streptomyces sp. NBC_00576]WUB75691.1 terpene synthase family protein [Streptomyces sp. NBC_00576]
MSTPSLRALYTWQGNPSVDLLNRDGDEWTYSMGLLPLAADPDEWADIGLADITAWCYPFAAEDELFLAYHLYAWMFALDLLFVRTFKAERDLTGARAMVDRLSLFMPLDGTSRAIPEHPIERSLADLWLRMTPTRSTAWKRNMQSAVMEYADGQCWELECMCIGRIPDPAEYLVRRRGSFGGHVGICLAEHVAAAEVPARVRHSRPFRALMDAWTDLQTLYNDVRSYRREVENEDETCNFVLVFAKFLYISVDEAATVVTRLRAARQSEYDHLVSTQLPALCEQLQLNGNDREQLSSVIEAMRYHLAAVDVWTTIAPRYQAPAPGDMSSTALGS